MRVPTLVLVLPLLLASCGRLPSAPVTAATGNQSDALARPAGLSDRSGLADGDTALAVPDVHMVRVARLGEDVSVALVGRPPAPGVHPVIAPLGPNGYNFGLKVDRADDGIIESFVAFPLDERHVRLRFVPFAPERATPEMSPVAGSPFTDVALHGNGTSRNFRFPASMLLSIGWTHVRWRLVLYSPIPGSPGYSTEYFHGTADLTRPGRPSPGLPGPI
jgi:hypothetical protein